MSYTVCAYQHANVYRDPKKQGDPLSYVVAGECYPTAQCWTYGETVEDNGIKNNVWVELWLRSGRVGYVSAVYLKGDERGGLPLAAQCFQGP